ncbi:alpha/beta fold hydrolase [Rhodococcus kronopolitis]|uniref:Alpha/beta fold hydrolase n=1 Tax=Rhodococcus kronopolitis TaxID=1460226 RepID=A0ABV9FVY0_9NOCA
MTNPSHIGRRPRCRTGMFAVSVTVLMVLSGCTSAPSGADGAAPLPVGQYSYAANPCPEPVLPGASLPPLGADFVCGTLTVPQDRTRPDGGTVTVPVARQRARNPQPSQPPLLTLAGGPGGSGLLDAVTVYQGLGLGADRDVIYLDQRGTLHATPFLPCPQVDDYLRGALARPFTDPPTAVGGSAAVGACGTQLRGQGVDLAAFNTLENAADLAALRLALNIPEWDVYGVSYGSDLALQYLRDYPDGVRAVVADSVVPPQMNLVDSLWPNAAAGFDALSAACAAQPACHAMVPDLSATLTAVVADLDAQPRTLPVETDDGPPVEVLVDGYKLTLLVNSAALYSGGLVEVPAIIAAAARGDVAPAAQRLARLVQPTHTPVVGSGLTYGVFCGEGAAHTSPETAFDAAQKVLPQYPVAVLRLTPQVPWLFGDCAAWDVGTVPDRALRPAHSTIPVLLLSGGLDGITPPGNAALAQSTLPNAVALTFPESGHSVLTQSECGPAAVTGFLDDPSPSYRPPCLDSVVAPPFATEVAPE